MNKRIFSAIAAVGLILLVQTSSLAQSGATKTDSNGDATLPPLNLKLKPSLPVDKYFVEIEIPIAKNGGFQTAVDEQRTTSNGWVALDIGFRPFASKITEQDGYVAQTLKMFEANLGYTGLNGPNFDKFLYSIEHSVDPYYFDEVCYDKNGEWDGTCRYCRDGRGYCTYENVYARDAYVKYSTGSISLGFYVPAVRIGRFSIEPGVIGRLHFISEGKQTDMIEHSSQASLDVGVKVKYRISRPIAIRGAAEQSITGFKYKQYSAGIAVIF